MSQRAPWLTASLCGAVVGLFVAVGSPAGLMLGEAGPWRLLTAHGVHLSVDHLLWDALAFLVLGSVLELSGRRRLVAVGLAGALAVGFYVTGALPDGAHYAGLSGINAALTGAVAVQLLSGPQWRYGAVLGSAFAAKLLVEQLTGSVLWVEGAHLPSVHVVGAAVGASMAALWR